MIITVYMDPLVSKKVLRCVNEILGPIRVHRGPMGSTGVHRYPQVSSGVYRNLLGATRVQGGPIGNIEVSTGVQGCLLSI